MNIKDFLIDDMLYKFKFVKTLSADLKQGELLETPTTVK